MNKKEYALVVNLDYNATNLVYKAWNILKKQNIKYISSRSDLPHITILHGIKNLSDANLIIKKNIIPISSFFNIYSNGLGVFVSKFPTIYIRWLINKDFFKFKSLLENTFKNKFDKKYSGNNWIPKSTIAYKDIKINQISQSLKSIQHIDFNFKMKVEKLSLISYSTKSKEKIKNEFKI